MEYGLVFEWTKSQEVRLVRGSPVYKNSVSVHKITLLADLVLGNVVTVSFASGGEPITQSITMAKTPDKNEWTAPLPDIVVKTSGTITAAFAILQPVVSAGETSYRVITTANQTFTVITSGAERITEIIEPTQVEYLQNQIDELAQYAQDQHDELIDLVNDIQPFIGENGYWYVFDKTSGMMVDSGVRATGPKGDKGDTGEPGPAGPPGKGLQIDGTVSSIDELPPSPVIGTAYLVGEEAPRDLYTYSDAWTNQGKLQGPKGDKGDKGSTYFYSGEYSYADNIHTISIDEPAPSIADCISICCKVTETIAADTPVSVVWSDTSWTVKIYGLDGNLIDFDTIDVPIILTAGGSDTHLFFRGGAKEITGSITISPESETMLLEDIPKKPSRIILWVTVNSAYSDERNTLFLIATPTRWGGIVSNPNIASSRCSGFSMNDGVMYSYNPEAKSVTINGIVHSFTKRNFYRSYQYIVEV
jgi:hypothetical protein